MHGKWRALERCRDSFKVDGLGGFADLTADVHWRATASGPAVRKHARNRRLVLVEVKYGDSALGNLHAHVRDVNDFAADPHRLEDFKQDMVRVFNQKWELGLINCGKKLQSFSRDRPLILLIFANHDPQKSTLFKLLRSLPVSLHVDVGIATASFLGYGLYEPLRPPPSKRCWSASATTTWRQGAWPGRCSIPASLRSG